MLSGSMPIPSFEDLRKILQFWIDQQDKWFYFEGPALQAGTTGEAEVPNPLRSGTSISFSRRDETVQYIQTRLVGRIADVVSYPPSLLLADATVFNAELSYSGGPEARISSPETRSKYGLVFSQITYYEPLDDRDAFLAEDPRVQASE